MTTDTAAGCAHTPWLRAVGHALLVVCLWTAGGCDRAGTGRLDTEFGEASLDSLTNSLNEHVGRGDLTTFDTGRNDYAIRLPGADAEVRFTVDLTPRTVFVPFGFANVRLNGLRFVRAETGWDAARQALRVDLDLQDAEDGLLAEVHTPVGVEDMVFFVSGGRVTVFLYPRAEAGRLSWAPLNVEIAVNTDDAVPAVRGPLRDAMRDVERDIEQQLRFQFAEYETALADWMAGQLAGGAQLRDVDVTPRSAIALAEPGREDTNGDGRVDIADLVAVARAFGQVGFSPADVNGDGRVDVADLVAVAIAFGR